MLSLPRIPSSTIVKDIICLLILLVSGQVSILQPLLSHTCVCRARCIVFLKSIFISFFTQTVFLSYHLLMLGVRYILYQQCLCTNCSEKPVHSLAVVLVRLGRDSNHLRKSFFFKLVVAYLPVSQKNIPSCIQSYFILVRMIISSSDLSVMLSSHHFLHILHFHFHFTKSHFMPFEHTI